MLVLKTPYPVVPLINADSNQHGPNENLRRGNYMEGIRTVVPMQEHSPETIRKILMANNGLDESDKEIRKRLRGNGRLIEQELSDIAGLSSSNRDVYTLTGGDDYLTKVAVEGLPELNELINRLAGLRDSIASLRTSVVLERIKENSVMPASIRDTRRLAR